MRLVTTLTVAALSGLIGTTALAQEATYELPTSIVAVKSTAQVRAELAAAVAAGLVQGGEATPDHPQVQGSYLSRSQVRAEAVEARRLGLIPVGEGSIPVPTEDQLAQVRLAGLQSAGSRGHAAR